MSQYFNERQTAKNPFYHQVLAVIGETQDGGKISTKDSYGRFLREIITDNSNLDDLHGDNKEERATVNMEEVADNLRYAIHEFTKALKVAEQMAEYAK